MRRSSVVLLLPIQRLPIASPIQIRIFQIEVSSVKLLILNGPNLNLLGIREPEIYGNRNYNDLCNLIEAHAAQIGVGVEIRQGKTYRYPKSDKFFAFDYNKKVYFDMLFIDNSGDLHIVQEATKKKVDNFGAVLYNIHERQRRL